MAYEIGEKVFIMAGYAIGWAGGSERHVGKEGVVVGRSTYKNSFVTRFLYKVAVDDIELNLDERYVTNVKGHLV